MKKYAVVVLALLLAGCAGKPTPIMNIQNQPIPASAQQMSLDRIEQGIIAAGQRRSWQMNREGPGHLVATQVRDTHQASVDIRFTQTVYSISHRSSEGMRAEGGVINKQYNLWVRNLQRDIDTQLLNANVSPVAAQ